VFPFGWRHLREDEGEREKKEKKMTLLSMHFHYWFHTISNCSYTRGRLYKNFRLLDSHHTHNIYMTEIKTHKEKMSKMNCLTDHKAKRRLWRDQFLIAFFSIDRRDTT